MCGIAGFWPTTATERAKTIALAMTEALKHRGPDARGIWGADGGVILGHARLSILDLSPAGAQPMQSPGGRYTLSFNGEIYNHRELRTQLERAGEAPAWRGHSDTETLVALIEARGIEEAFHACRGMFAVAIWDAHRHTLTLARDRFGEKPLYWTNTDSGLLFASELKALMVTGLVDRELSMEAAAAFLHYSHIPAPYTPFKNARKVMPGQILEFESPRATPKARTYWSVLSAWEKGRSNPFNGSSEDAVNELEARLSDVVKGQMLSDVPLGAFLSGGIDSSTIVALMQSQSARPVQTFSIGFAERTYDESTAARSVAAHLGTAHHEFYLTPQDALALIPRIPETYCEPFADSSQLATQVVSRLARRHVTVALTGDGGDELFGGYNRYLFGTYSERGVHGVGSLLRILLAKGANASVSARWDRAAEALGRSLPPRWRVLDAGNKLHKVARALSATSPAELYETLICQGSSEALAAVPSASRTPLRSTDWSSPLLASLNSAEQMMVQDAIVYLPNDILTKVDRATMAYGLEGRVPFLDHTLYEFAASLPFNVKIRGRQTKWVLRQVLDRHVPTHLTDRPKSGFAVPIDSWLRGELREWAEELLAESALERVGVFDVGIVRRIWETHLSGKDNLQNALWCVLMYQAWHERWIANG